MGWVISKEIEAVDIHETPRQMWRSRSLIQSFFEIVLDKLSENIINKAGHIHETSWNVNLKKFIKNKTGDIHVRPSQMFSSIILMQI